MRLTGESWRLYNKVNGPNKDLSGQEIKAAEDGAWELSQHEQHKAKHEKAARERAENIRRLQEGEKTKILNELNAKGIKVPGMDGLSLEEQLQRLREIKKICDEIEGKYGKWDDKARDEAQKKVDEISNGTSIQDLTGLFIQLIDWGLVMRDVDQVISSGFSTSKGITDWFKYIRADLGNIKNIGNVKMTVSGARDIVKQMTGLTTGPKTMLSTAVKNSISMQKADMFKGASLLLLTINIATDLLFNIIDLVFGLIDGFIFTARFLVSILYHVLKTVGGAILRGFLTPFIGPFAWIVGMIVDFGIDWIEKTWNLRETMVEIVVYIMKQGSNHISKFIKTFVTE